MVSVYLPTATAVIKPYFSGFWLPRLYQDAIVDSCISGTTKRNKRVYGILEPNAKHMT